MQIQEIKNQITQYLEQLPEEQLHQLAEYAALLVDGQKQINLEKKITLIHSLRGKYINSLSSSEDFALNKQDDIDNEYCSWCLCCYAYIRNETGAEQVENYFIDSHYTCMIHIINLCEVYYDILRNSSHTEADKMLNDLKAIGIILRS